jgi:hypothetical protein
MVLYHMCMVLNSIMVRGSLADFISLLFLVRKLNKYVPCSLGLWVLFLLPNQMKDLTKICINLKLW